MNKKNILKTGNDLIYLIKCMFLNEAPDELFLRTIDLKNIHELSQYHGVESIAFNAVKHAGLPGSKDEAELFDAWEREAEQTLYKNTLMQVENETITAYMEENAIWHVPLKGVVLDEYYPKRGLRQMMDNDILIDPDAMERMRDYMVSRGYTVVSYGRYNHDDYIKKPAFHFELHRSLYGWQHEKKWQEYYKDIKDRLLKQPGTNYGYHFGKEDFYIYVVLHAYKHYDMDGIGLKALLDEYLYLSKEKDQMDWDYIKKELLTLGISTWENDLRHLSLSLFMTDKVDVEKDLSFAQKKVYEHIVSVGIHGTLNDRVQYSVKKIQKDESGSSFGARAKYLYRRIFPDSKFYERYYPKAYKKMSEHRLLVPLVHIWRIFHGIFTKPAKILREFFAAAGRKN